MNMTDDSLFLNNVKLRITKSTDSVFHISAYKYSNGSDEGVALNNVKQINYGINQQDSLLWLDRGFSLQRGTRFRNQSVTVTIQVPVGKRIVITRSVNHSLNDFHFNSGRNDWDFEDEDWSNHYDNWRSDVEYIMTPGGLEKTDKKEENADENNGEDNAIEKFKKSKEELQKEADKKQRELDDLKKELNKPADSTRYHYKKVTTSIKEADKKPLSEKATTEGNDLAEGSSLISLMQIVS